MEHLGKVIREAFEDLEKEPWSVLKKAQARVEENLATYGTPFSNFLVLAGILTNLGFKRGDRPVVAGDIPTIMIALKLARQATGETKLDNWVDIAGYAACAGALFDDFSI